MPCPMYLGAKITSIVREQLPVGDMPPSFPPSPTLTYPYPTHPHSPTLTLTPPTLPSLTYPHPYPTHPHPLSPYHLMASFFVFYYFILSVCITPELIGVRKYGVHINGYFYTEEGSLVMWIGKRSILKPKYPGLLDNIVCVTSVLMFVFLWTCVMCINVCVCFC